VDLLDGGFQMTGPFFPNPARHAVEILGLCDGDLEAARELARINVLQAQLDQGTDFMYWCDVMDALVPAKAAQC
jgi:hypothetical protein